MTTARALGNESLVSGEGAALRLGTEQWHGTTGRVVAAGDRAERTWALRLLGVDGAALAVDAPGGILATRRQQLRRARSSVLRPIFDRGAGQLAGDRASYLIAAPVPAALRAPRAMSARLAYLVARDLAERAELIRRAALAWHGRGEAAYLRVGAVFVPGLVEDSYRLAIAGADHWSRIDVALPSFASTVAFLRREPGAARALLLALAVDIERGLQAPVSTRPIRERDIARAYDGRAMLRRSSSDGCDLAACVVRASDAGSRLADDPRTLTAIVGVPRTIAIGCEDDGTISSLVTRYSGAHIDAEPARAVAAHLVASQRQLDDAFAGPLPASRSPSRPQVPQKV